MALWLRGVYRELNVIAVVLCCQLISSGLIQVDAAVTPALSTTQHSTDVSITPTLNATTAPTPENATTNESDVVSSTTTTLLLSTTPGGQYFESSTSESYQTDSSVNTDHALSSSHSIGDGTLSTSTLSSASLSSNPITLTTSVQSTRVGINNGFLSTGEVIGIVVGVLLCGVVVVIVIICLRKYIGPRKTLSAPVTYRRGTNFQTDRAPLTTKDKDPSPPPDGTDDQYFFDDDIDRRFPVVTTSNMAKNIRHLHEAEEASLDGDVSTARDGGDDDYFYDEIFEPSAFTDEITNASIKELSTPVDEEIPDLIFRDDDDEDDLI